MRPTKDAPGEMADPDAQRPRSTADLRQFESAAQLYRLQEQLRSGGACIGAGSVATLPEMARTATMRRHERAWHQYQREEHSGS
jgi:hypothetical protein